MPQPETKQKVLVYRKGKCPPSFIDEPFAIITRKLWTENIGNFNPIFCRYRGKKYLVESFEGDLSDPFRRDETYITGGFRGTKLYIEF